MNLEFSVEFVGDDPTNQELRRYRIEAQGDNTRVFEVIISTTAKTQAKPSPEEKIKQWLRHGPVQKAGTSVRIPDEHLVSF